MRTTPQALSRQIPKHVKSVLRRLSTAGFEAYVVGGAVRSLLLNIDPSDFDIATDALPDQVTRLFRRVIPTGVTHGTVTVVEHGLHYEITTFRSDGDYEDSRRPTEVEFVRDIGTDLDRRDFAMNAIALDPLRERVIDPHSGARDIAHHVIRAIGDPLSRFTEDALRMLRAPRFASQLGFSIESGTLVAITELSARITAVSAERIRDELTKIVLSERPSVGLRLLHATRLLEHILPELAAGDGVTQRGQHQFDVLEHSLLACDAAPDSLELRLAALLHDIGKPPTLAIGADGERTFHGHDKVSADLSADLLRRLKYPNRLIDSVTTLVRHHMFAYTPEWTDAAIRRFIVRVGADRVRDLVALRVADSYAVAGQRRNSPLLDELAMRVEEQLAYNHAFGATDLAISGNDLIEMGVPRGPRIGIMIDLLLETVLDDPNQNSRETLLRIARRTYEERFDKAEADAPPR